MNILDFLNSNDVVVGEQGFFKENKTKYQRDTDEQISLIVETQKILMGKKSTILPRIESSIGKEIESFIVQVKKVKKMVSFLRNKEDKNDFDYFIIDEGSKILVEAIKCLNLLNNDEYLRIISRSMNNYEMCLGRVDEGSLKKDDRTIYIRTIRYLSYNMIEHDCYSYIKRLKRHGYEGNIDNIINDFAYKAQLNKESITYMNLLVNYPIESIKALIKLKYDKDKFTEMEWIKEINSAKKIDSI